MIDEDMEERVEQWLKDHPPVDEEQLRGRVADRLQLWWLTQKHDVLNRDYAEDMARSVLDLPELRRLYDPA